MKQYFMFKNPCSRTIEIDLFNDLHKKYIDIRHFNLNFIKYTADQQGEPMQGILEAGV